MGRRVGRGGARGEEGGRDRGRRSGREREGGTEGEWEGGRGYNVHVVRNTLVLYLAINTELISIFHSSLPLARYILGLTSLT